MGFIDQLIGRIRRDAPPSPQKSAPVEPLKSRPTTTTPRKGTADAPSEPRDEKAEKLAASFRHGIVDARFLDLDVDRRFVEEFDQMVKANLDAHTPPASATLDVVRVVDESPFDAKKAAAAIAADATLKSAVTALAGSPLHRGESATESFDDAVARLGQNGLRLVLYETVLHLNCVQGRPFDAFSDLTYKHSLLTAQLARSLATAAQLDVESACAAGLFHDVGVFAVLGAARHLASKGQRPVTKQTVLQLISRAAAGFEQRIVERWKLPAAVAAAVAHRRAPEQAGDHAPLAAVTQLANDVCRHFGAWAPQKAVDFAAHPALKLLKIAADKVPARADVMAMAERVEQVAPLR